MRQLRWMLPVLVLAGLGLQPAAAQQPAAIERLNVALWPEYDQPSMLVILHVQLAPGTALPAQITLPMPASAGEPLAVAYSTPDGGLLNAPYSRQVQGDWALITLTSETASAQVEYYQPLEFSDTQRSFTYQWPGGQDLASMTYEVQHPVDAQAMTIDPPPDSTVPRPDGLQYSYADLGPVSVAETRQIQLSYQRESSALSIETTGPSAPPVTGPAESAGAPDVIAWLPVGLSGIGALLVILGGALYWRSRRHGSGAETRARHRPKRSGTAEAPQAPETAVVFCHSCGTQSAITDKFCRQCGTRLRG